MYNSFAIVGQGQPRASSSRRPTRSNRCRLIVVDGKFVTQSRAASARTRDAAAIDALVAKARAERPKVADAADPRRASMRGARRMERLHHRRVVRASARRSRGTTRRRARRSACSRGAQPSSTRWPRRSRRRAVATYAGDVRDAGALAARRRRFHRALRRARRRHRQRRHLARRADRARRKTCRRSARSSTPTCSASSHTFAPFVAAMRAARRGALVGIASVAGFRGLPGSGAYSASKAAAIAYLESLRVELRGTRRCRRHDLPGLHRDADDRAQSVSRCRSCCDADEAARRIARAIERRTALLRAAVADGDRRARAADAAAPDLRRAVRARAAQAAAIRIDGSSAARAPKRNADARVTAAREGRR